MISNQVAQLLFLLSLITANSRWNETTSTSRNRFKLRSLKRSENETGQHWTWDLDWDWEEYKQCKAVQVCLEEEEEKCGNGVSWKNLSQEFQNASKVDIINMSYELRLVQEPADQIDIQKYKQEICYLAFATYMKTKTKEKTLKGGKGVTCGSQKIVVHGQRNRNISMKTGRTIVFLMITSIVKLRRLKMALKSDTSQTTVAVVLAGGESWKQP